MLVNSVPFTLEQILNRSEVVILDSNIMKGQNDSILDMVYDFDEQLLFDQRILEEDLPLLTKLIHSLNFRDNVFIPEGVVQESRNYLAKVNGVVVYHTDNFRKRKMSSYKRKNGRYEDTIPFEPEEERNLNLLRAHTNKFSKLIKLFPRKKNLSVNSVELLSKVVSRTKERKLKEDKHEVYRNYEDKRTDEYKQNNLTDEEFCVTGYELAKEGKNVALISCDKDVNRIIQSCFYKEHIFKIPKKGSLTLYFIPPGHEDYRIRFDSTLLLYNKR